MGTTGLSRFPVSLPLSVFEPLTVTRPETLVSLPEQLAWAPSVLEPLVTGLQARGFCFKTLRSHPAYSGWIQTQASTPAPTPAK